MAGRLRYFLIGGAAIFAGMVVQGDVDLEDELDDHQTVRIESADRGDFDSRIDRIVDRATHGIDSRGEDDRPIEQNPAIRAQMIGAISEMIRAEVSLAKAEKDKDLPKSALEQAQKRRDAAKLAVDRLADEAKAVSRDDREEIRDNLRDEVRDAVRDGVRG